MSKYRYSRISTLNFLEHCDEDPPLLLNKLNLGGLHHELGSLPDSRTFDTRSLSFASRAKRIAVDSVSLFWSDEDTVFLTAVTSAVRSLTLRRCWITRTLVDAMKAMWMGSIKHVSLFEPCISSDQITDQQTWHSLLLALDSTLEVLDIRQKPTFIKGLSFATFTKLAKLSISSSKALCPAPEHLPSNLVSLTYATGRGVIPLLRALQNPAYLPKLQQFPQLLYCMAGDGKSIDDGGDDVRVEAILTAAALQERGLSRPQVPRDEAAINCWYVDDT